MTVFVGSGVVGCDECGSEFEVIPTNDSFSNEISFCPFCGSEVAVDVDVEDDED